MSTRNQDELPDNHETYHIPTQKVPFGSVPLVVHKHEKLPLLFTHTSSHPPFKSSHSLMSKIKIALFQYQNFKLSYHCNQIHRPSSLPCIHRKNFHWCYSNQHSCHMDCQHTHYDLKATAKPQMLLANAYVGKIRTRANHTSIFTVRATGNANASCFLVTI